MNSKIPRGVRNDNPGNIRIGNIKWQGVKDQIFDPSFLEFKSSIWGLRALMKVLLTYFRRHNLDDVQAIINRWAPPVENATDSYIDYVAKRIGVKRDTKINLEDPFILIELAKAITMHENGRVLPNYPRNWYRDEQYFKAAAMALGREILFTPIADKTIETKAYI